MPHGTLKDAQGTVRRGTLRHGQVRSSTVRYARVRSSTLRYAQERSRYGKLWNGTYAASSTHGTARVRFIHAVSTVHELTNIIRTKENK